MCVYTGDSSATSDDASAASDVEEIWSDSWVAVEDNSGVQLSSDNKLTDYDSGKVDTGSASTLGVGII